MILNRLTIQLCVLRCTHVRNWVGIMRTEMTFVRLHSFELRFFNVLFNSWLNYLPGK